MFDFYANNFANAFQRQNNGRRHEKRNAARLAGHANKAEERGTRESHSVWRAEIRGFFGAVLKGGDYEKKNISLAFSPDFRIERIRLRERAGIRRVREHNLSKSGIRLVQGIFRKPVFINSDRMHGKIRNKCYNSADDAVAVSNYYKMSDRI